MTTPICVLGGGAMGTACACVLAENPQHDVRLWARNPTFASHIAETRFNSRLLPGIRISDSITVTSDQSQALADAEMVVVCIPTRSLTDALTPMAQSIAADAIVVSAVKGIEAETLTRPSELIENVIGQRAIVAFGGPCHAEEVANGKPASVVAAGTDKRAAQRVQQAFATDSLRVYTNADLAGVELAGAFKNVMAIAAGICDGLEYGDNARSALMTRGLAEMVRFGTALGAQTDTFFGLAGIGDLIGTCGSPHSRNRHVGERLGRGESLEDIRQSMQAVAEGVFTAQSVRRLAEERSLDLPIATEVYRVLFEDHSPREATLRLMRRPLKGE